MFSPDYYDKLDPSYREALRTLESKLEKPQSDQSHNDLMDFVGKHMITQELWDLLSPKNNRFGQNFTDFERIAALYFFCEDFTLNNRVNKYYNCNDIWGLSLHHLSFPHRDLDIRMKFYERKIYSFIPTKIRQRHEEMKALYLKIKAAEGDLDEWFAALMEANDHQFVCDNVEYQLGEDLTDKKLWKKYINYLKEHDFKLLIETYSKYCRFFTDDIEMKEEYRKAAVKYNDSVFVPWKNPFHFEYYDDEFWEKRNHLFKFKSVLTEIEPLTIHFDGRNATKPQFPFLSPTIRYILDHANGDVLQKLFKTCKWFLAAKPINVCYKFEDRGHGQYKPVKIKEQSIKSFNNSFLNTNIGKLFISTVFNYSSAIPNALSELIPRIYRCTAKYVDIWNQNLSLEDLQVFIGNAVELNLLGVCDSDGKEFKLESILKFTPKIKSLKLSSVKCSAETSQKLCEMEFQNKLEHIYLSDVKADVLDSLKFSEFFTKNCSANATIRIYFRHYSEYITRFRQVLGDAIKEKWTADEMPDVEIFSN